MSICDSGIKNNKIEGGLVNILVTDFHPLIKLANILPWEKMFEIILPDLKKTPKGQYRRGRKLKIRPHLGIFLLQQFYNRTDRQIEYDVKENAVFQLFCGKNLVLNWHCPDHTKIEEFRSRLSPENQRQLANLIAINAAKVGFADTVLIVNNFLKIFHNLSILIKGRNFYLTRDSIPSALGYL